MKMRLAILVFVCCMTAKPMFSCEWARGYFHQVTAIRGQVVGKRVGLMQWRWLRQSFVVTNAELALYKYPDAYDDADNRPRPVARVKTDEKGSFEFGNITAGHYTLVVRTSESDDWFDVEVTPTAPKTDYMKIDVSPNRPDCTGGHEFIVRTKS